MPTKSKLKRKPTTKQDIFLAIGLGVVVTAVGIVVTRYSQANIEKSFTRNPVTQMQGGQVVTKSDGRKVRLASSPAPGVDAVYTLVSKKEMENTKQVCVDYVVKKTGTFINVSYNAPSGGLSTSRGTTKNSGGGTECVDRGAQAVDGTINVNVTPGAAQITSVYGVLRDWDD